VITALPERVYRVARDVHCQNTLDALSGIGGLYASGRWHRQGQRIIYTSESTTLCILERMVHADEWIAEAHRDRMMLTIKLPSISAIQFSAKDLSAYDPNWQREGNSYCERLGSLWLDEGTSCTLIVPSAANPMDSNILMNPMHSEFQAVIDANDTIIREPVALDERVVSLAQRARAQ
jgi:RES domain-containing protein